MPRCPPSPRLLIVSNGSRPVTDFSCRLVSVNSILDLTGSLQFGWSGTRGTPQASMSSWHKEPILFCLFLLGSFSFCFKHIITFINSLLLSIRTLSYSSSTSFSTNSLKKPNTRHFWSFFFLHTKSNWPYNTKRNCWVLNHVLSFELQNKLLKQCQIDWNDDACMLVHLCAYLPECNWL